MPLFSALAKQGVCIINEVEPLYALWQHTVHLLTTTLPLLAPPPPRLPQLRVVENRQVF